MCFKKMKTRLHKLFKMCSTFLDHQKAPQKNKEFLILYLFMNTFILSQKQGFYVKPQ